jgi:ATP-dependent DNA helicase RecG
MHLKENETLELKKSTAELDRAIISIVSMLNKQGHGDLYFGVKNDGTVVGQEISENTIRHISQSINARIDPKIFPEIKEVTIDNKTCVYIRFEGNDSPYYADGRAYVRVGDEDKKLSAKELENIIIKKNREKLRWDNRESNYSLTDVNEEVLNNYLNRAKKEGRLSFDFQDVETTLKKLKLIENNKLLKAA